jgi:LCP family protein required for cell wall assembly
MVGGAECTVASVSNLLNVPIDYYIQMSFDGLIALIDSIGGITLTATNTFCEQDENANQDAYCFEEGVTYEMDGSEALAYARNRYSDNDYGRAQRQQEVISAIVKKILTDRSVDLTVVWNTMQEYMATNITLNDITSWTNYAFSLIDAIEQDLAFGGSFTIYVVDPDEYSSAPFSYMNGVSDLEKSDIFPTTTTIYDESQKIYKKVFATTDTNIASQTAPKNYKPLNIAIEVQSIVLQSLPLNTENGWYSYPSTDALYYTSNYLRECMGLEEEMPKVDYSTLPVD